MVLTPEQLARQKIDAFLQAAGWVVQDPRAFNRNAALGVAIREFQLPSGPCDYLLFVQGKAAGVIEAKKAGITLSGIADQSDKYMARLPDHLARWQDILLLDYESTGEETMFRDMRDPKPRSRYVFAFHKPETLLTSLQQEQTLRARLQTLPELDTVGLRDCQIEAIRGLEKSLAEDRPRSLIQMATGAGKTFAACTFSNRLITYAGARRILFLVDRTNLGDQTLREYQGYRAPGAAHSFADTYNLQHLRSNRIDRDAKVVIATIQRVYAMLRGQELADEDEEASAFETWEKGDGEIEPIAYNRDIPIETFDFIVTDECHRSIYGVWRQVLSYFDAHIVGLTATPSKHTLGFFGTNLVSEYPYERSVADGVNVGYEIFRIRTKVGEHGGKIEAGYTVPVRDKRTRATKYRDLDKDLEFTRQDLDNSVTARNQIRAVLQSYKDNLFTQLFPDRSGEWVPKTLIFAKDDNHAEEIVHIVREVFGQGNDFAKKITYRNTGESPKALIKGFRVDPMPRIAVTVDMIATGTDIKPVEVLIFMRDVRSEGYYEQMKGRGVRSIAAADLQAVTPDAKTKTRFVLIDAVGVSEGKKNVSQPLERKRTIPFDKLIDQIAQGRRDDDGLSSLAGRLAALDKQIEGPEDRARIIAATSGKSLRDLASDLLNAIDPDAVEAEAQAKSGHSPTAEQMGQVEKVLKDQACAPFDDADFRQLVKDIKQKADIVIDEITTDEVITAEYDLRKAEEKTTSFRAFIEANKDELLALQILYSRPAATLRLTYAAIRDLVRALTNPPWFLATADIWQAYRRLNEARVKGAPSERMLTDIISLVRFAIGADEVLEPFSIRVEQRFNLWIGRQKRQGREFTAEQLDWLRMIRDHVAANAEIRPRDLIDIPAFADRGGLIRAKTLFGATLDPMLDELSQALVA